MKQSSSFFVLFAAALLAAFAMALASGTPAQAKKSTGLTLSGVVWQDFCAADCFAGSSLRAGNGVIDLAERRQEHIKVKLNAGPCGSHGSTQVVQTNGQGRYTFTGLSSGIYCLRVNARQSTSAFPRPGYWSSPIGSAPGLVVQKQVNVKANGSTVGPNFGWNLKP